MAALEGLARLQAGAKAASDPWRTPEKGTGRAFAVPSS
jgi:hypothetical protein